MRIRTDHMSVNKSRPVSLAAITRCPLECGVACYWIVAVDFFEMKIGKSGDQSRNASARSLDFDRHRDRIAVIFDAEDYWKLAQSGSVHSLPKFAFAGSAVAKGNVGNFIALE